MRSADLGRANIHESADGFSIVEVLVATVIVSTVLLSLVGVMSIGVSRAASSSASLIAREKAREAVESVHTARDTGALSWATVRNVAAGGVFLSGPTALTLPGDDGLVNTADDGAVETLRSPGADGILDNSDDLITPLTDFTREIAISDLMSNDGESVNENLRQITITITFRAQGRWRTYTLRTFVSSFS